MNGSGTCPITNAALVELGVIGYTSIHKGQWFQAGISAAVFLIPQYLANLILGKIEEGGDDETCRPYGLVSFPPLKGSIAQWITVTMNIVSRYDGSESQTVHFPDPPGILEQIYQVQFPSSGEYFPPSILPSMLENLSRSAGINGDGPPVSIPDPRISSRKSRERKASTMFDVS